jgi:DNA-binding SARP family transcriptional activator
MTNHRPPIRPPGPPDHGRQSLQIYGFGQFRAEAHGAALALSPILRAVLARLVLAHGGLVETEVLYRDAWPDPVPVVGRPHRVAVHRRVVEIRRLLAPRDPAGARDVLLTERSVRTGYRLFLDLDQVDLYRFEDLVLRAAATRDLVASRLLTRALALWTASPLLDLPDRAFVRDHVSRLRRLRDDACRDLATAARALDRWPEAAAVFDHLLALHREDDHVRRLIEGLRAEPSPCRTNPIPEGTA